MLSCLRILQLLRSGIWTEVSKQLKTAILLMCKICIRVAIEVESDLIFCSIDILIAMKSRPNIFSKLPQHDVDITSRLSEVVLLSTMSWQSLLERRSSTGSLVGRIAAATIGIVICRQIGGCLRSAGLMGWWGGSKFVVRWRQIKAYLSFQKKQS